LGTEGEDERKRRLIVKEEHSTRGWKREERTARVMEIIAEYGFADGRYRVPVPLGKDSPRRAHIEKAIHGHTLFEAVTDGDIETAQTALKESARWLARLHNLGLEITPPEEFFEAEAESMARCVADLEKMGNPNAERVRQVKERVLSEELERFEGRNDLLVQGHGDFHPKNILVGRDKPDDRSTFFVAAIDFGNSHRMPKAYDVGMFLAQFRNQFFEHDVFDKVSEEMFFDAYLEEVSSITPDFCAEAELFKARAGLSILYFLGTVDKGETENFWRVLVESEHSLAWLAVYGSGTISCSAPGG
jgi:hypothetical protein